MDNIKTLFRLYRLYAKLDFLWLLRDGRYFLLQFVSDLISGGCTVAGVWLLSRNFKNLAGMSQSDVLFMMGYAVFIDGLIMIFFIGNNTLMVSRIIGRGQLDHLMIQPVPVWAQLLAQGFSPFSGMPMLIFGIWLTVSGARKAAVFVSPAWLLLFLLFSICSSVLILSCLYLLSCSAFYAPAAAEEIAEVGKNLFSSLKTYPLGNMNGTIKKMFLTVIPVGLSAWFPSSVLLQAGKMGILSLNPLSLLYLPGFTVLLLTAVILLFKKGMKYYATYGSPRYSSFGHR